MHAGTIVFMVNDIRGSKRASSAVDDENNDSSEEMSFVPPDKIADEENINDLTIEQLESKVKGQGSETQDTKPQANDPKSNVVNSPIHRVKLFLAHIGTWWANRTKKQKIMIVAAIALAILSLIGTSVLIFGRKQTAPKTATVAQKKEEKKEAPKPTTEASHLTGVPVPIEYNLLPVTGVMIENSPDARPQSGLNEAGVVFEAVAEGGITRFLTLFQEAQPGYIGPVRSVRPYYLQWLQGFDAAVAHVGGSGEALAKIQAEGIKDLDQSFNGAAYERVSQRYAPHNVYTSLGSLIALGKSKGFNSSAFTGFPRKADKPAQTPNARSIDITISGPLYNVHYSYDGTTNSYLRNEAGTPHKDEKSGKQISPKVVIAIVLPQGIDADRIHTTYNTIGTGTAFIFQDGTVSAGTWSKASPKEQIRFGDASSAPISLNAGQTWITAVGSNAAVTYVP